MFDKNKKNSATTVQKVDFSKWQRWWAKFKLKRERKTSPDVKSKHFILTSGV